MSAGRVALIVLLVTACGDPGRRVDGVDPGRVSSLIETAATITGAGLRAPAQTSLDDDRAPEVDNRWQVRIGATLVEGSRVTWRDAGRIDVELPAGLPLGLHDVTVIAADGVETVGRGLLEVVADPIGLSVSVEDAPGGAGAPIDQRTLAAGAELAAYAVLRDDQGVFVDDVEVAWALEGATIGGLTAAGAQATLTASTPGTARLAARHPVAADDETGELTVVAGPPATVSLEDAPGGIGAPIGARSLSTDDSLTVHAVGRDAFGNFTGSEAVAWAVTGGIGVVAGGPATSTVLDPRVPGQGVVEGVHATLPVVATDTITVVAGRAVSLTVAPDTATLSADDPALGFGASGLDADGNTTADVGTLTWTIASGPIGTLDAASGALDPTVAGTGAVRVNSSYGISDDSGPVTIVPGRAAVLAVVPDTLTISADAAPTPFSVSAVDADGNPTADLGVVTWSIATGPISAIAGATGVFTPTLAGAGTVRATSSHGVSDDSGLVTVVPGAAVSIAVAPDTASVSADDPAFAFTASGIDADGNAGADVGTLGWSIASGPISSIGAATGVFDPTTAGTGRVRATSSYGPVDDTQDIVVTPGRAAVLTVSPDSATTYVGGASVPFNVAGVDADGNATTDLGAVAWSIGAGPIASIDGTTGVLTPTADGLGAVRATSSYGPFDDSGAVNIARDPLFVQAVVAPPSVTRGQRGALVEVHVTNVAAVAAQITAVWLSFEQLGADLDGDYEVVRDPANPITVAAGATAVWRFRTTVAASPAFGTVDVVGSVQGYLSVSGGLVEDDHATSWTVLDAAPPTAIITKPVPPGNRICTSGKVDYEGQFSTGTGLTFLWQLTGGSPSTGTSPNRNNVNYNAAGSFPYRLTVTDTFGNSDSVAGAQPIFVGTATAVLANQHITGAIPFEDPTSGQVIDMDDLPDDEYIDMDGAPRLLDCAGNPIDDSSSYCYVTVFTDRGLVDASRDVEPTLPGVQVEMHDCDHFDDVELANTPVHREGDAIVYAEFRKQPENVVTAAGYRTFRMGNDIQRPYLDSTVPFGGCPAACLPKSGEMWLRFVEPMAVGSVVPAVSVRAAPTPNCASGSFVDITASSTVEYVPELRAVRVLPAVQPQASYAVSVTVGSSARDASSNGNTMASAASRCWVVDSRAAPALPATPGVSIVSPFSPNADLVADASEIKMTVDSATAAVRVEIVRGPALVRAILAPAAGPTTVTVSWDGRDDSGRVVPDGYYGVRVYARNGIGGESPAFVGVVEVATGLGFVGVPPR